MACQQGLTFRSTAQMALEPGEELLPIVCGSPQPSGRCSSEVRGCGSAPGSPESHHGVLRRGSTHSVAVTLDG